MSAVDAKHFVMSHVSLTARDRDVDDDSLPSPFFQATLKKKRANEVASARITDRQSLERRRNCQTKENEQMLDMLESMENDETFVESTLATLEYPISTNNSTAATLLKEIIDTTAPYHPMPQWKSAWKQWRKSIVVPTLVWPNTRQMSKYAPWMAVLIVYFSCRLAWYEPSSSVMTDTERITLKTYHDGRLRGGLSPSLQQQQLLPNNILSSPLETDKKIDTSSLRATKFAPKYEFDKEQPYDGDAMQLEKAQEYSNLSQPPAPGSKSMISVPKTPNDTDLIAFQERVQKLKDLSDKGHISIASRSGPVTQFLYKQQRNEEKLQEGGKLPESERALENETPALELKEQREQPLHEQVTQPHSQDMNPQLLPQQKDQESISPEKEAGSKSEPRKPHENATGSPGLISLKLV